METFLSTTFLDRPLRTWIVGASVLVGGILIALLVRAIARRILRRAERQSETGAATGPLAFGLRAIRSFLYPAIVLGAVYGSVSVFQLEGTPLAVTNGIFVVLFSLLVVRFVVTVVNAFFTRASEHEGGLDITRLKPLRSLSIFVIYIAGLLFLLDNLGFDITAIIAGLGIGGIAVALAAQALLGDLFSYFVILFDKPFETGDFLIFGDILGSVEKIGIKTTRLRSLSGEQISVSNSDLTSSRVRNYKRMERRRIVFHVGVVYDTPSEKLQQIPSMIREVVESRDSVAFDRVHFAEYGDWSLTFETVYYVLSPDYNVYMDIQQEINFAIYDRFEEEGIEFAFPTQTVNVVGRSAGTPGGSDQPES